MKQNKLIARKTTHPYGTKQYAEKITNQVNHSISAQNSRIAERRTPVFSFLYNGSSEDLAQAETQVERDANLGAWS
jgi:hypothetical protein